MLFLRKKNFVKMTYRKSLRRFGMLCFLRSNIMFSENLVNFGKIFMIFCEWSGPAADPENFGRGMIKIFSTKPQKFGCVVTRRVAKNSQWSCCFRGLGVEPPAL